jgi:anti-sigma B factor antagonist
MPMSAPGHGLEIRSELDGSRYRLWLAGELDLASAGRLDTCVAELCADGAESIEIDMSDLEFMDSTGLRSLLVGLEICKVNECEMTVGAVSAQVERLLEVSGLGARIPRRPDLTDAPS